MVTMNRNRKLCHSTRCLILSMACLLAGLPAQALEVGQQAPGFSLAGLRAQDGVAINLADFRGKVVYVDFWASWCAPCLVSIPLLNELRNRLVANGAPFEVVAINVDQTPQDGIEFLLDSPVDYVVASDSQGDTPAAFQVPGMPTAFLLDAQGTIHLIHTGFKRSDITLIEAQITTLLGAEP